MSPKVVPLIVTKCPAPCGWEVPINLSVFGLLHLPITVAFDCPRCGRSFEQHVVKSTEAG